MILFSGLALQSSVAVAAPSTFEATAGGEISVNDPFLVRRGIRVGGAYHPLPVVGVTLSAAAYPNFGEEDQTVLHRRMVRENQLTADLSRMMGLGLVGLRATPLRSGEGPVVTALHLGLGAGVVSTLDDLASLQAEDNALAIEHEVERHGTWAWSVAADILWGNAGVRGRYEQLTYTETVMAERERKSPVFLGIDAVFVLGGKGGEPG